MKKLCLVLTGYLLIGLICYSRLLPAKVYIPADNVEISKVTVSASPKGKQSLAALAVLVEQGQFSGQSEDQLGRLRRQLQSYYRQAQTPEIAYLYARVLQRQHEFSQALNILTPLLAKAPERVNARLLQANILMVQGFYSQAKQSCLALTGHVEIAVIAICALDAISQGLTQETGLQEQLKLNYQTLIDLLAKDKQQAETLALWANQVLAEMALRLNLPLAAQHHLSRVTLSQSQVSLIALWADIELILGNYDLVLRRIPALVDENRTGTQLSNVPDALLLRLALAEKKMVNKHSAGNKWQALMAERVKLREIRQDKDHAADLARYYLDIKPDAEKAEYWAVINFQQAKMATDRTLLRRALLMRPGETNSSWVSSWLTTKVAL